jgi:acetolactate synthase-1/2/3 large subunit
MGVQLAHPRRAWSIDIAGEASVQMTMQETVDRRAVPACRSRSSSSTTSYMGMVRQWQQLLHGERYSRLATRPALPDFVKLAEAFGCRRPARLAPRPSWTTRIRRDDRLSRGPVIFDCVRRPRRRTASR